MQAQAGFKRGTQTESPTDLLVRFGPTLLVAVGIRSRTIAGHAPDLPLKHVRALIDTGANGNCIDDIVAREIGLPLTAQGEVSGIGGRYALSFYMARVYVPSLHRLLFERFAGVKLEEGGQWHRVILGRNFLRPYRMTYDAPSGGVELSDES